jgi:hypothetical protein
MRFLQVGDMNAVTQEVGSDTRSQMNKTGELSSANRKAQAYEPRGFMYTPFLHHSGLANIQYKTFFHMCRLEGISFDMESRSGSTFCLTDCL